MGGELEMSELTVLGACEAIFDAARRIEALGGTQAETVLALSLVLGAFIRTSEPPEIRTELARSIWSSIKLAATPGPESGPVARPEAGAAGQPPNGQARS